MRMEQAFYSIIEASMTQATLSPELTRQSVTLARALAAAVRNWGLYPPEHPAVGASVKRLSETVRQTTAGAAFTFGVTPKTLLVAGWPLPEEQSVMDAARLLHDHDILEITFVGDADASTLHSLLTLLVTPADELRAQGGPAKAWASANRVSIAIEQIDYEKILEDHDVEHEVEKRDDIWRSVVNSIVEGRHSFDHLQQQRLLEIAGSPYEIHELANAVSAPKCAMDGSPLITTQAATVLATFRHLAGIVTVMDPDRLPEVMRNVAAATASLDAHVVMQIMQTDEGLQETPILGKIAQSFDDEKVAQLLATALSRDGKATARLARIFDTIAPDAERKQRVLRMTKNMLSEHDFGRSSQFKAVWNSMEELLLTYDESPYVSASYQASLEGAVGRSEMFAALELPPELPEWVESLQQDNVRSLSVLLITDLLRIEEKENRADEIAGDMTALLDDLLMSGDFSNSALVLRELREASKRKVAPAAMRAALTIVGESVALGEAATMLSDFDQTTLDCFVECCESIGPIAVRALHPTLQSETETPAYIRGRDLVGRFGAAAIPYVAPLADDNRWFVQRNAAALVGSTRSPEAVPPLQGLLRRSDPRVLRQAVSALAGIDDPAAARAIQTALRTASGPGRTAVVEALVAEKDPRVIPMLIRILGESDPFGEDHQTVLDTIDAVRQLADDRAVDAVAAVMRRKRLFTRKKARAVKLASVEALRAIRTPRAKSALDDAARTGDRLLKKIIRDMQTSA
jgi:CBS domain-containing protein